MIKKILSFLIIGLISVNCGADNSKNIEVAKSLLAINKPDKAIEQIKIVMSQGQKFNSYAILYLECLIQLGLNNEFYDFIEKNSYQILSMADRDRSSIFQKMAELKFQEHKINDSKELYQKSLDLCSENLDSIVGLAKIAIKQQNFWEAKKYLKKAEAIDEFYPDLLVCYGDLHSNKGNQNLAISYYKKALEQNNNHKRARDRLANAILEDYLIDIYSQNNDYMIWQLIDPKIIKPE